MTWWVVSTHTKAARSLDHPRFQRRNIFLQVTSIWNMLKPCIQTKSIMLKPLNSWFVSYFYPSCWCFMVLSPLPPSVCDVQHSIQLLRQCSLSGTSNELLKENMVSNNCWYGVSKMTYMTYIYTYMTLYTGVGFMVQIETWPASNSL